MTDEEYMRKAVMLANRAWGRTSPNPMVGAVLVKDGRIIGEGFHHADGCAHAEIECLRSCTESPEGATLYVTLEPCSTKGRTGACTEAIISANIARVKIGTTDPNPLHAGRAGKILQSSGIDVEFGVLEEECKKLNFIFNSSIISKKAFVAMKYAVSSDGKISAAKGIRTRITSSASSDEAMRWRARFDSIGIGFGTLLADNPRLDVRGFSQPDYPIAKSPVRLLFDSSLKLAEVEDLGKYNLFSDAAANRTRVICDITASESDMEKLAAAGIKILRIDAIKNQNSFWDILTGRLYRDGISSLLLEGGAQLWQSACDAHAPELVFEYTATNVRLGDAAYEAFPNGKPFEIDGYSSDFGNDTLKIGKPVWIAKA